MLEQGILQPSDNECASSLHMVNKNSGGWHPCGDYRRLNSITVPDRYPTPHLQDFTYQMSGKTIFTTLDLKRSLKRGLVINVSKCVFGLAEVRYLGYTVSQNGIKPPLDRIDAIANYTKPTTIDQLRKFLGAWNFYRGCMPGASQVQAPLVNAQ